MKVHLTNVLASKDITLIEGDFKNPPDDPFRCPPTISMVGFHRNGEEQIQLMRIYFTVPTPRRLLGLEEETPAGWRRVLHGTQPQEPSAVNRHASRATRDGKR
jgi:hypothetical protein